MAELGERIAALVASFEAEKQYQHDRWHKLDQDLTPVVMLPEKLVREIAKLQGTFEGRMNSISKEFERSLVDAIEKALRPVVSDVSDLQSRVNKLEIDGNRLSGVKIFLVWAVQTILAAIVAAVVLVKGQHP